MSDREADERKEPPHDYEQPAIIIKPPSSSNKDHTAGIQRNPAKRAKSLLERLKSSWKKHATPMNVLTLIIAAAAWAQFHLSQKQIRLDERAWVGPSTFPVAKGLNWAKGAGQYTLTIKNFGKTPALKFMSAYTIFPDNQKSVPGAQNASCDTRMYDSDVHGQWGHVLWPGEIRETTPSIETHGFVNAPHQPKEIYIAGCVTYDDIFGFHHWTKFCYVTYKPQIPDQEFQSCFRYNETDGNNQ